MAAGLFIDEQYIKEMSYVDENMDVKLIGPVIAEAQEIHMLEQLGTGLYNELSSQIDAGTLTALNRTLLDDYVCKSLKYWTMFEGIDSFVFKFKNRSIVKQNAENTTTIELNDLKRLKEQFRDKAQVFDERLTRYLIENSQSYPLYLNPGTGADIIHPKRNNYKTGIFLGGRRKCGSKSDRYENPGTYC